MLVAPIDGKSVVSWVLWAWKNREQLKRFPSDAGNTVVEMIQNGGEAVQRIGSTIVFGAPDGGQRVLGFLDQTTASLDGIKTAVGGLQQGQVALTASLASLQTISMVTLGLSAVTPLVIAAQFRYLWTQFNDLKKEIRMLAKMVQDQELSKLESGLGILEKGIEKHDRALIEHALPACDESRVFFNRRVADVIDDRGGSASVALHLARHLAVATCASARCYVALGHDDGAAQTLDTQREVLKSSAQFIFRKTVGRDPARFLIPHLSDQVSMEFVRSLFQQALHAGIEDGDDVKRLLLESDSASGFFEALRPTLFRKRWGWFGPRKKLKKRLLTDLRQAAASIEETNRVFSLRTFLDEAQKAGKGAIDVLETLDKEKQKFSKSDAQCMAWSL